MLKIKQNIGNTDTAVMTSLRVFSREGRGEAQIPNMEPMAGATGLYEHLHSKQTSVPADQKDRPAIWMDWLENQIEARYQATGGGLEIIADILQTGLEDPLHLTFGSFVAEGGRFNSRPFAITREQSEHLRRFLEQLALKMGLEHPDLAPAAAVLVVEETILRAQITGSPEEAQTARLLFQCLQHA